MATPFSSASTSSQNVRTRRFTAQEVIEQLTTNESDVEDYEDDAESDGWLPDSDHDDASAGHSSDTEASDHDSADEPVAVGLGQIADADPTEDEFLQFLLTDWNEDFSFFPTLPAYGDERSGLHIDHMDSHAPLDFFPEMFDNNSLEAIVEQTNKYARENIAARGELKEHSLFKRWPEQGITVNDLLGFFTICVHMSCVHKPHITDYWSTCPFRDSSFCRKIMSRDRFLLLLSALHVSDNDSYIPRNQPGHDPLHKIRPVYDHLRHKYRTLYTPKENICVDEAMCPWRGKLGFRVYMRDKPVKWGIKLYELCESDTAYVYDFEVFAGIPQLSNRPVDVVCRLAQPLLGKGRSVYVDNYYCCPELADRLVEEDTHTVGTIRPNRKGLPSQLKTTANPPRGQVQAYRQGAVSVLRWMDKKPVHLLTTKMDPRQMKNVVSRTNPNNQKMKPEAVQDYINNMAGVDKSDQLMAYTPFHRKTMKWWKKMFFHLFTLTMIQASILHNIYHTGRGARKMPLKDFVVKLGLAMNDKYQAGVAAAAEAAARVAAQAAGRPPAPGPGPAAQAPPPQPGPSGVAQARLSGTGHFAEQIGKVASGSGKNKFRVCQVCYHRSKRHEGVRVRKSNSQCSKCGVALCQKPFQGGGDTNITCFQLFHTIQNYVDY